MKTKFHTDNARPCYGCGGTIASYTVDDTVSLIDVFCYGCHRLDVFEARTVPTTAAECSAVHRSIGTHGGLPPLSHG